MKEPDVSPTSIEALLTNGVNSVFTRARRPTEVNKSCSKSEAAAENVRLFSELIPARDWLLQPLNSVVHRIQVKTFR